MATGQAEIIRRQTCAICLEHYQRLKLLPCRHTFCLTCLHCLAPPPTLFFLCPLCRKVVVVPPEGFAGLQACQSFSSNTRDCQGKLHPYRPLLHMTWEETRQTVQYGQPPWTYHFQGMIEMGVPVHQPSDILQQQYPHQHPHQNFSGTSQMPQPATATSSTQQKQQPDS